jgi:hypothetical protein
MSRERLTSKALTAADASFGQSANDYWRNRAKDAIQGALSEVERELWAKAQEVTDKEAQEVGVAPARYASEKEDLKMAMVFEPRKKEASEKVFEPRKKQASEEVCEPRSKEAGAPVDPSAIGVENWFQVQKKFPQYCKQGANELTMLAVAPTKRNMEAVEAVTETLDAVASNLEESGNVEAATQLDVISDLLTASVQESQKIKESKQ